jgi:HlyD family secretion protein
MDRRIARPAWKGPRALLIAAAAVVVAGIGALAWMSPAAGSLTVRRADLEIASAARAPFQDYLPVRAEAAPLHTVFLAAIEGGQVKTVSAVEGAEVAAGQPLAMLSNPQLELDVTSREASIASQMGDTSGRELDLQRNQIGADQALAEARFNLLKAERELGVRQRLHDQGFLSDAGLLPYAQEAAYARERLAALQAGSAQEAATARRQADKMGQTAARLKNNLGVVQASLDALVLRAPVAGRLTSFDLQPGQTLKAGDQVGQIDSEGGSKLTADVDEFYLGRVAVGEKASAALDGRNLPLTVARVLPKVTDGRFRIELAFQGAQPQGLKRGQTLDVKLVLGDTRPALVLPNGAWLDAGGGTTAFVLDPGRGRADRRGIAVGRRNPDQVEITSGLRPGERVVVSSYAGYAPFQHLILSGGGPST